MHLNGLKKKMGDAFFKEYKKAMDEEAKDSNN